MMNLLQERIWRAVRLMPSLNDLTDKVLDWIGELGLAMAPAAIDGLIYNEARTRVPRD